MESLGLRFQGTNLQTREYTYTVLFVTTAREPSLTLTSPRGTTSLKPLILDQYQNHFFYKYQFTLPAVQQTVIYSVGGRQNTFYTPDFDQRWNLFFYSCNGICSVTDEVKQQHNDIKPLWVDVHRMHSQVRFHGMIGGGDQIYCDDVFNLTCFENWIGMRDKAKRMLHEYSPEMKRDTEAYYFNNYMNHFNIDGFREALAQIPFNFTWDDHDIFDGYGSYPLYLQTSHVFKGIFQVALRFYLLFQQHTNLHLYRFEDFGHNSHSTLRLYGPKLAVVSPDVRSERSLETIIPEPSWQLIWNELDALPKTVEHLIVNATIPLAYPRIKGEQVFSVVKSAAKGARNLLDKLQSLTLGKSGSLDGKTWAEAFCKTGAYQKIVNGFGEPELLDDLSDHWTSDAHEPERKRFVQRLQNFAREKQCRVSILSGDVHVGGCGMFHGKNGGTWDERKRDERFMIQMISSAIGNVPPPYAIIKHLHMSAAPLDFDPETVEEMYAIFPEGLNGTATTDNFLMNVRNWCMITWEEEGGRGIMRLDLRMELEAGNMNGNTKAYTVRVPPLVQ